MINARRQNSVEADHNLFILSIEQLTSNFLHMSQKWLMRLGHCVHVLYMALGDHQHMLLSHGPDILEARDQVILKAQRVAICNDLAELALC